jgi:hypothetical protein
MKPEDVVEALKKNVAALAKGADILADSDPKKKKPPEGEGWWDGYWGIGYRQHRVIEDSINWLQCRHPDCAEVIRRGLTRLDNADQIFYNGDCRKFPDDSFRAREPFLNELRRLAKELGAIVEYIEDAYHLGKRSITTNNAKDGRNVTARENEIAKFLKPYVEALGNAPDSDTKIEKVTVKHVAREIGASDSSVKRSTAWKHYQKRWKDNFGACKTSTGQGRRPSAVSLTDEHANNHAADNDRNLADLIDQHEADEPKYNIRPSERM